MDPDEKKPAAPYSGRFQKFAPNTEQRTSISHQNHRQDELHHDPRSCGRPTYALRLRAEPGVDAVRALRAALKNMLRRYGLRCLSAHEEKGGGQ
jgi:hypothetical protein